MALSSRFQIYDARTIQLVASQKPTDFGTGIWTDSSFVSACYSIWDVFIKKKRRPKEFHARTTLSRNNRVDRRLSVVGVTHLPREIYRLYARGKYEKCISFGYHAAKTFNEKYLLGSLNLYSYHYRIFLCICFQRRYAFIITINFSCVSIFVDELCMYKVNLN